MTTETCRPTLRFNFAFKMCSNNNHSKTIQTSILNITVSEQYGILSYCKMCTLTQKYHEIGDKRDYFFLHSDSCTLCISETRLTFFFSSPVAVLDLLSVPSGMTCDIASAAGSSGETLHTASSSGMRK